MVVPDVLTLLVLKNTFRDGIFTLTVPFTVDSDTEVPVGAIHKEDVKKLILQLANLGATNSFDFQFYGAVVDDQSHGTNKPFSPPPDFDVGNTEAWFPLPNGSGTILPDASDAESVSDNWTWVLLTIKRTTAGQDTTGSVDIRGE